MSKVEKQERIKTLTGVIAELTIARPVKVRGDGALLYESEKDFVTDVRIREQIAEARQEATLLRW